MSDIDRPEPLAAGATMAAALAGARRHLAPRRWLISIPCWGEAYTDLFHRAGLPALERAIAALGHVEVIIDRHEGRPGGQWFQRMSGVHRSTLDRAKPGDAVVLLTADMVISTNALTACRERFIEGKKLICCNATRTVAPGSNPAEFGRWSSRDLSTLGWLARHQMTADCTWPDGAVEDLHRVYFERGGNVVTRQWLPHPLAVMIDRPLRFGPTIDSNLVTNFRPREIHVVTDPDELAAIELSPADKQASRDANQPCERKGLPPMYERYGGPEIYHRYMAHDLYRWLVGHRIVVVGQDVDCGDDEAVKGLFVIPPDPYEKIRELVGQTVLMTG